MDFSLIGHVLPSDLLKYFSVINVLELGDLSNKSMFIEIHLEEKNSLRSVSPSCEYESKGFRSTSIIQDFPLRGKAVYLKVKRRRWRDKQTRKDLVNDYSFLAEGSKLTKGLSDFLKETNRYKRRYN